MIIARMLVSHTVIITMLAIMGCVNGTVPELFGLGPHEKRIEYHACNKRTDRQWYQWGQHCGWHLMGMLADVIWGTARPIERQEHEPPGIKCRHNSGKQPHGECKEPKRPASFTGNERALNDHVLGDKACRS